MKHAEAIEKQSVRPLRIEQLNILEGFEVFHPQSASLKPGIGRGAKMTGHELGFGAVKS